MKKDNSGIYDVVDEKFISNFNPKHYNFMKDYYYKEYNSYCERAKIKALPETAFFTNMRHKKIKLMQLCCPYCGTMKVMVMRAKIDKLKQFNYCWHCGKSSTSYNVFSQLSSFVGISHFHLIGLKAMQIIHSEEDMEILTYEVYHLELVQLTSILEVILRDFFEAFIYINYFGMKDNYIANIINKSTGNDFMNIEKANKHYKKALNINLHSLLDDENWMNLLDLVSIRNTIVHNNGMVDDKFKMSNTFEHIRDCIKGKLIILNPKKVSNYLKSVKELATILGNLFDEKYSILKYGLIANYYFNTNEENLNV